MTDFKAKMHQIRFRLGSAPDTAGGAYSAPSEPVAGLGAASRQGERLDWRRGGKREGKGREGEVDGREREGPKILLNQGPSQPCYATDY